MLSIQSGAVIGTNRIPTSFRTPVLGAIRPHNRINTVPEYSELYNWIKSSDLVSLIDVQVVPFRQLLLPGRINFIIQLKAEHAKYFAVLNGLFELGVSSAITIKADKLQKRFALASSTASEGEATTYLTTVFRGLQQEIEFRNTLRRIRAKEEQFARELKQLYQTQFLTA